MKIIHLVFSVFFCCEISLQFFVQQFFLRFPVIISLMDLFFVDVVISIIDLDVIRTFSALLLQEISLISLVFLSQFCSLLQYSLIFLISLSFHNFFLFSLSLIRAFRCLFQANSSKKRSHTHRLPKNSTSLL